MAWEIPERVTTVFVGIPHQGLVSASWAMNVLRALGPYLQQVKVFTIHGYPIDVSRVSFVEQAIANNADYVYFLDSDIYTTPETLRRLISLNLPIVTALYYRRHALNVTDEIISHLPENTRKSLQSKRQAGMPVYTCAIWKDFVYRDENGEEFRGFRPIFDGEFTEGQLIEVDGIPMGCCLIRTDVFRKLPRPWFLWTLGRDRFTLKDDVSKDIQHRKGVFGCSEDLYFSILARKYGIPLLCDTSLLVGHETRTIVGARGQFEVIES